MILIIAPTNVVAFISSSLLIRDSIWKLETDEIVFVESIALQGIDN